jgi:SH3-like domain-containing protein
MRRPLVTGIRAGLRYIQEVNPVGSPTRKTFLPVLAALLLSACGRHQRVLEIDYVSAPQVVLRDQLAQVYTKVGTAENGEKVEVLDRDRRFAKVRTRSGLEGWVEQRYLVTEQVFQAFQALAQESKSAVAVGNAITRNETNLHVSPGRDTDHLYQLAQAAKVSVLRRSTVEKSLPGGVARPVLAGKPASPAMEDWWLVRDVNGHTGWVLGRLIDLDVPLEVAQYAEGQRIVGCFALNEVTDQDKKVPQYLMLLTENKDGMPFDFNQARVFTWNLHRHRYETAYRERGLNGFLPVTVSHEIFGKEGDLPTFILRVKDAAGNLVERKYKMNTPIVRRVN